MRVPAPARSPLSPLIVATLLTCCADSPTEVEPGVEYVTATIEPSVHILTDSVTVIVQFSQSMAPDGTLVLSDTTVLVHGHDWDNEGVNYRISVISPPLSIGELVVPEVSFWLTVDAAAAGSRTYRTDDQGGSGFLRLTEVTDSLTVGTFAFEAIHVDGNPETADVVMVSSGSLQIRTPERGRAP
jgi:hypothetical protein